MYLATSHHCSEDKSWWFFCPLCLFRSSHSWQLCSTSSTPSFLPSDGGLSKNVLMNSNRTEQIFTHVHRTVARWHEGRACGDRDCRAVRQHLDHHSCRKQEEFQWLKVMADSFTESSAGWFVSQSFFIPSINRSTDDKSIDHFITAYILHSRKYGSCKYWHGCDG